MIRNRTGTSGGGAWPAPGDPPAGPAAVPPPPGWSAAPPNGQPRPAATASYPAVAPAGNGHAAGLVPAPPQGFVPVPAAARRPPVPPGYTLAAPRPPAPPAGYVPAPPPGFVQRPDSGPEGPAGLRTSELHHLARASSLGFVGQASSSVLAFGFSLIVGRVFKAHGTGTFYEAVALFTIASTLALVGGDFGLNRTVPRLRAQNRVADIKRLLPLVIAPVFLWSVVLAVVLYATAPLLTPIFSHHDGSSQVAQFVRILAPYLPFATLIPLLVAGTRGFDRVWPLVTISSVGVPVLRLVILGAVVGGGMGLLAVAYAWAVPMIVGALACLVVLLAITNRYREDRIHVSAPPTPSGQLAKEFWSFTAPRSVASAFNVIVLWLDVLLVGGILSTHEAGIYAIASRYMFIPSYALGALGGTIGPQTARLVTQGRLRELRDLYHMSATWAVAASWPVSFCLAVFAPVFMGLFGRQFVQGSTALTILSLVVAMSAMTGNSLYMLIMAGDSGAGLLVSGVSMAVNVVGNVILIPRLGINGAAVAWGVTLLVNNVMTGVILWRRLRLQPFTRLYAEVALTAFVCFGLIGAAIRVAFGANWATLAVALAIGSVAYGAFLHLVRDRIQLSNFLHRRRPVGAAG